MVAFTFILREKKGNWSAIRCSEEEGELQADADSTYDLQQKLYQLALQNSSGGGVKTSFSTISPKSAIYQVIVGGPVAAGGGGGGSSSAAAATPAAAAEEKKEDKKEEEEEEEDEDMGFSLFD